MTEKLASTIIPLYDEHAAAWERLRPTTLFERPWLDRFLQLTPANARLLDLGCGNGAPIAAYFIEQGYRVTGVDGAQAMIAHCRQRFPQQEWRQMDMRQLDLATKFDGLLAWDSFFHLARNASRCFTPAWRRRSTDVYCRRTASAWSTMWWKIPPAGEERSGWRRVLSDNVTGRSPRTCPLTLFSADAPNGVAHVIRNQQGAGLVDR